MLFRSPPPPPPPPPLLPPPPPPPLPVGLRFPVAANVDEDDCCWAIVIGVDGCAGVWKSGLGVVGSDVTTWIGVCCMIESSGPSTIVDGEDGVSGFSSTDSKVCWRNCNGDRSKVITLIGEGGLVGRGDGWGAGLPCRLGMNCCFPNTLDTLVEVSGSSVLGGRLRRSRSSLLLKRNNRFVLFR